jgi:hypothetical protein
MLLRLPLLNQPLLRLLIINTLTPQGHNGPINALQVRTTLVPRLIQLVHLLLHRRIGLDR